MRKLFFAALIYMIIGLASGLYYREFTHADDFHGYTQLAIVHTHLLTLGMMFFLILIPLEKLFGLTGSKLFGWFFWVYNLGLVWTATFMVIHGTRTVDDAAGSPALDGISGAGHIILTAGIILFFALLSKRLRAGARIDHMGRPTTA